MEKRRIHKNKDEEYNNINAEIKRKCNLAKVIWLNEECSEIEKLSNKDTRSMHQKINKLCGRKTSPTTGCLRSKSGEIIMEKEKIKERWIEYIGELYNSQRNEHFIFNNNGEGPPILKDEVRYAMNKMKHGKAPGPDKITSEILEALEDFGLEKVTKLVN